MTETYSSFQRPVTFMYFGLNYCDENHHIERIPIGVKNIVHLFHMASEIIKTDRFHLYLLSDGTRTDDNEYLESLENSTKLIVCTEERIQKLSIYFEIKKYLNLKDISYPLEIIFMILKITMIFNEAVINGTSLVLFRVFFNSPYIYFEQAKRV